MSSTVLILEMTDFSVTNFKSITIVYIIMTMKQAKVDEKAKCMKVKSISNLITCVT